MPKTNQTTAPAAMIAGYSAKMGQRMMGHEGMAYRATIFRDGKKIGTAHDAGEGGSVTFDFDSSEEERLYDEVAKRESTEFDFEQDSGFLGMLLDLASRVKNVTKWAAQGYGVFIEAYKGSCKIGDHFILGEGALMALAPADPIAKEADGRQRDHRAESVLVKKGYDSARWVNADGSYGAWFMRAPEDAPVPEPKLTGA